MDLEIKTLQPTILRIDIIFPAISIFIVALRLYSRTLMKRIGWDDILVTLALILAIAGSVVSYGYTKTYWQGYHNYDIPLQTFSYQSMAGKYNLANQALYNPILVLVRASIIAFILSLRHLSNAIKYNLYAISAVNAAFFFSVLFPVLFQCHPFHYSYDKAEMDMAARIAAGAGPDGRVDGKLVFGGSCIVRPAFFISTAIVSICLDLWLLVIPSAMVWGINMPKRQKAVVIVILSFWVVATIFGILRLGFLARAWLSPNLFIITDSRYSTTSGFHWIEVNLSIWTAAVPALKPMINRWFPSWWKVTRFEQGYDTGTSELESGLPSSRLGFARGPSYRSQSESRLEMSPGGTARRRPVPWYLVSGSLRPGITQSQIELYHFEHGGETTLDSSYYHFTPEQGSMQTGIDESGSVASRPASPIPDLGSPEGRESPRGAVD